LSSKAELYSLAVELSEYSLNKNSLEYLDVSELTISEQKDFWLAMMGIPDGLFARNAESVAYQHREVYLYLLSINELELSEQFLMRINEIAPWVSEDL
jgi:hypothetical protein